MLMERIELPVEEMAAFCRAWKIAKLEIFGSVLRPDFGPESDLDFLYTAGEGFDRQKAYGQWGHNKMAEELASLLGREVDLIERSSMEKHRNWIRRQHVLSTAQPVYVEG